MVLLITKRTETISLEYCAYKLLDMYDVFFEIRIMIKFFFFLFFFLRQIYLEVKHSANQQQTDRLV